MPLVKVLWWGLLLGALAFCVYLSMRIRTSPSVLVSRAAPGAAMPSAGGAPCPPGFLPDQGACIPVPRPAKSPEGLQRQPDRPVEFAAYTLPVQAPARLGSWSELPLHSALPKDDATLLIAAPEGTVVHALRLDGAALRLDGTEARLHARGPDWVLLSHSPLPGEQTGEAQAPERFVVLYAPLRVDGTAEIGSVIEPTTVLGTSVQGGLGVSVRKLRPGKDFSPNETVLAERQSIPTDPRNVLPLLAKP